MKTGTKRALTATIIAIVLISGAAAVADYQINLTTLRTVPTVRAMRGDVEIMVVTEGELRAPHSSMLVAPPVNGTLQLISILPTGTKVKPGDIVAEFDPSEQEYNLELNESQLKQAEQDIIKAKADADVQAPVDQAALIKARFDVRSAELDVMKNELLSDIDAKKNDLALQENKRKLAQLEQDVKSRAASGLAGINVLEATRSAAELAIKVAKSNIENMTLKSTIDGIVSVKENRDANGLGWNPPGIVLPEFRAGDLTNPGRQLAIVLDMEQMEVAGKISEDDRSNVNPNQPAEIVVDAHPDTHFSAKVKDVASMAGRDNWSNTSSKKFDASFKLDSFAPDLKPGVSTQIFIHGNKLSNVIYLPTQCLFEKDGKKVVYVRNGTVFEAKEIKVKYRTESKIVLEGIQESMEIALVDPTANGRPGQKSAGSSDAAGIAK